MDKVAEPWARDLIKKVGRAIVGGGESATDVFRQFDKDDSGFLEYVSTSVHGRLRRLRHCAAQTPLMILC
eukprot:COSAG02_NODE_895_length_16129_cov_25.044604_5_plen_70_part_00